MTAQNNPVSNIDDEHHFCLIQPTGADFAGASAIEHQWRKLFGCNKHLVKTTQKHCQCYSQLLVLFTDMTSAQTC